MQLGKPLDRGDEVVRGGVRPNCARLVTGALRIDDGQPVDIDRTVLARERQRRSCPTAAARSRAMLVVERVVDA